VYPTADGQFVLIAANQDTVFGRFAQAIGRPDLCADARYATHSARGENQGKLDDEVSAWTRVHVREEILARLDAAGVPVGLIYRVPDMLDDPQFLARESLVTVEHPQLGRMRMQNVAPKLSATPGGVSSPSPRLGEHNAAVYGELLGMDAQRLASLRDAGII
jgi:formyl-CoA transferase